MATGPLIKESGVQPAVCALHQRSEFQDIQRLHETPLLAIVTETSNEVFVFYRKFLRCDSGKELSMPQLLSHSIQKLWEEAKTPTF